MKISVRQSEGVTVLQPSGKITIGVGDVALREAVHEALNAGSKKILVSMSDVSMIDSSGVGELVSAYTTVTNRGGKLALSSLTSKVADVLQVTQLVTVFDIHETEEDGISALSN